jgi:hypothetical protein
MKGVIKMTNLERLKVELSGKEYFSDEVYSMYLEENALNPAENYDKSTNQKELLYTVIDVLESLSNDIDLFRSVKTEFLSTGEAYKYLEKRINDINKRILALPNDEGDTDSNFSNMYYN